MFLNVGHSQMAVGARMLLTCRKEGYRLLASLEFSISDVKSGVIYSLSGF